MFSKAKSILDAIEETIADIIEQVHLMWEAIRADRVDTDRWRKNQGAGGGNQGQSGLERERWVPGTGAGTPTRPGKPGTDWRPRPIERPTRGIDDGWSAHRRDRSSLTLGPHPDRPDRRRPATSPSSWPTVLRRLTAETATIGRPTVTPRPQAVEFACLRACVQTFPMRTISLVSTKGGCGKTALSCALAVRFDAVLLDLDPQASACRWRDRRDDKEPVVTDVAPARLRPTLDALAEQGVDVVVIDTPPRSETAALEAVRVADLVVVPCRAQIVDVETVSNTLALLTLARSPLAVAVLMAVPPRGQRADQARSAITEMGLRVCPHTIGHRAAWGDAAALGLAVQEHVPAGRAAGELRQVADWLRRVCDQPDLLEGS